MEEIVINGKSLRTLGEVLPNFIDGETSKALRYAETKIIGKTIQKHFKDANEPTSAEIDQFKNFDFQEKFVKISFKSGFSEAVYKTTIDLTANGLAPKKIIKEDGSEGKMEVLQAGTAKQTIQEVDGKKKMYPVFSASVEVAICRKDGEMVDVLAKSVKDLETTDFRSLRGFSRNTDLTKLNGKTFECTPNIITGFSDKTNKHYAIFSLEVKDPTRIPTAQDV